MTEGLIKKNGNEYKCSNYEQILVISLLVGDYSVHLQI